MSRRDVRSHYVVPPAIGKRDGPPGNFHERLICDAVNALGSGFNWDCTREGAEFWVSVVRRITEMASRGALHSADLERRQPKEAVERARVCSAIEHARTKVMDARFLLAEVMPAANDSDSTLSPEMRIKLKEARDKAQALYNALYDIDHSPELKS